MGNCYDESKTLTYGEYRPISAVTDEHSEIREKEKEKEKEIDKESIIEKIFTNLNACSKKTNRVYCKVIDCFIDSNLKLVVKIDMVSDGSSGPCPDPSDSTVTVGSTVLNCISTDFTRESEVSGYAGDLIFEYNGEKGAISFVFADDDYSKTELGYIN